MSWLKKFSQKFSDGQLAIYSHFGVSELFVVEILSWENAPILNDEYKQIDENTIRSPNSEIRKGESTLVKILSIYKSEYRQGLQSFSNPGKVFFVNESNIYPNLESLFKKELSTIYPDSVFLHVNADYINKLAKDYPELVGNISPSNLIDYQSFDVMGYEVQILNDLRAAKTNPSIMKTKGTEGLYYWSIPELQTRSLDNKKDIDRQPWETGRFPTRQLALNSAEKYINHLFYSENS